MQASEAIRGHHRDLIATFDGHVVALASGRADVNPTALLEFLKGDLLPHARGEERHLYPALEPLLREYGRATATMSVDHEFIENYVNEIAEVIEALQGRDTGAAPGARDRLERLVLQLQAVLEMHLEKEERVYLPLMEQHLPEEEQDKIVGLMHSAYD